MFVEWASRLLQVAEEVDASLLALRAQRDRELRVLASMTVAEHLLPRWLVAFRQREQAARRPVPSISLQATNSAGVLRGVVAGEADLGFVEGADRPSGLTSVEVGTDELVLVAAPTDPLARRRSPLSPAQVAGLALTSRERGSGTREVVEQALAAHDLTAAPAAVEVTTSAAVRETVRAGGASAFLSRRAVEADLRTGALVAVRTTGLELSRTLRAVWAGGTQPPARPGARPARRGGADAVSRKDGRMGEPDRTTMTRDLLANERTYLAWLRTAASLMLVGLAVARLLDPGHRGPLVAGALLVVVGAVGLVYGTSRFRAAAAAIERGDVAGAHQQPGHAGGLGCCGGDGRGRVRDPAGRLTRPTQPGAGGQAGAHPIGERAGTQRARASVTAWSSTSRTRTTPSRRRLCWAELRHAGRAVLQPQPRTPPRPGRRGLVAAGRRSGGGGADALPG